MHIYIYIYIIYIYIYIYPPTLWAARCVNLYRQQAAEQETICTIQYIDTNLVNGCLKHSSQLDLLSRTKISRRHKQPAPLRTSSGVPTSEEWPRNRQAHECAAPQELRHSATHMAEHRPRVRVPAHGLTRWSYTTGYRQQAIGNRKYTRYTSTSLEPRKKKHNLNKR